MRGDAGPARGGAAVSGARADCGATGRAWPSARDHPCLAGRDLRRRRLDNRARTTGVVNDALALYFEDAAFAHAFVVRFCCGFRVETIAGDFARRGDARSVRRGRPAHKDR